MDSWAACAVPRALRCEPQRRAQHIELYDNKVDEYQMHNVVNETSDEVVADLHSQLDVWFNCQGASCV